MSPLEAVLTGTLTIVAAGVLALLLARSPRAASQVATWGAVCGSLLGFTAAARTLTVAAESELAAAWAVPGGGLIVGIDPLSAFFLLPLFALGALCAVYGRSYLGPHPAPAAELNLLIGVMALVLLARHGLLFLVAWEAMTILAYLLITFDHRDAEVRRAGWIYLIAGHASVTALIAVVLLLGTDAGGSLAFNAIGGTHGAQAMGVTGLLCLALLGFGIKAGVVGLHVWLPEAHAAAPSHVSALMSGVLIKLGLYGLLRVTSFVPPAAWFGVTLMVAGLSGALLAIIMALHQRDLKRVLAYSSVENIGIISLALGLGLWARAHGERQLAAIALGGGLLHIWNHAAMKGLLFLCAGSIIHGAGTRDIERLGGLLRRMPRTGWAMIVGALAIAGLPPLNGFAGEWLLYRALSQASLQSAGGAGLAAMAGAAALAAVGGLAALCFLRVIGIVLLGAARSESAAHAHEAAPAMTTPLVLLTVTCLAGGVAAPALVARQTQLIGQLAGVEPAEVSATALQLWPVAIVNLGMLLTIPLAYWILATRARRAPITETWGCGYAAPSVRMQYTGSAFSEFLASRVLPRWLRARERLRAPEGPFPQTASFASVTLDPFMRAIYEPLVRRWVGRFARLRFLQQGSLHLYILYIFLATIISVIWVAAREWVVP